MPRAVMTALAVGAMFVLPIACEPLEMTGDSSGRSAAARTEPPEPVEPPLHQAGTVGEYAVLMGGGYVSLQGYGVVIGLGRNGARDVPQHLRKYLRDYLTKHDLGLWTKGMQDLPPDRFLSNPDTAAVLLGAAIPPGAPIGSRFDVQVSAFAQTETGSLDGGILLPAEMRLAWRGQAQPGGPSFVWAEADGSIFVNPFLDFSDPAELVEAREGRLIGGLRLRRSRPIKMQLRRPDYQRCRQIEQRINEKFGTVDGDNPAKATDAFSIELRIPRGWREDYERFLELVMHLPLMIEGPEWERHERELADGLGRRGENHDEIALVLEAAGRPVLPVIKPLYLSENDETAFYAARTGLRLEDYSAGEVIAALARKTGSPLQLSAIEELGEHPKLLKATPVLRELLNAENEMVRVAAYKSLLRRGDGSRIERLSISDEFELDLVKSSGPYVIYATQTRRKRIALFGEDMTLSRPVFFKADDDLVTVDAGEDDEKVQVFRRVPWTGRMSESFDIDFYVRDLIRLLGTRPVPDVEGRVHGLGLTYGQVVRVLQRMCSEGDIPGKFVLQPPPEVHRILRDAARTGRPDMPE